MLGVTFSGIYIYVRGSRELGRAFRMPGLTYLHIRMYVRRQQGWAFRCLLTYLRIYKYVEGSRAPGRASPLLGGIWHVELRRRLSRAWVCLSTQACWGQIQARRRLSRAKNVPVPRMLRASLQAMRLRPAGGLAFTVPGVRGVGSVLLGRASTVTVASTSGCSHSRSRLHVAVNAFGEGTVGARTAWMDATHPWVLEWYGGWDWPFLLHVETCAYLSAS